MVTQYPHILVFTTSSTSPTLNSDGVWEFGTTTSTTIECRAEANSKGVTVSTASGDSIQFDYIVFTKSRNELKFDTECQLTLSPTRTIKAKVKRFELGQLNARIWI